MKKAISAFVVAALAATLLVSCGAKPTPTTSPATKAMGTTGANTEANKPTGKIKTGLGVAFSNKVTDPKDGQNGKLDTQAYAAALLIDPSGKILDCAIDSVQSVFEFTPASEIATPATKKFESKNVLGDKYGMRKASPIKKEWNEQAKAIATFVKGKTLDKVMAIAQKDGKISEPDLATSATVNPSVFQEAIKAAFANAVESNATATDKIGVGVVSAATQTKAKADDKGPASAVAYNYYTATTFDASGKITSVILDASQGKFDTKDGKIATDLKALIKTKNELKDQYGMKKASKIQKEWYEQAAAFAKSMVGKTVDQVKGIAVDDKKKPADPDLATSVTIHISEFQELIELALRSTK